MSKNEILLTISILVSGQPENVRRCFASLQELRAAVPCELLVTDTGCAEETKQVIAQYADRVLHFTWCKDFSKARNLGLQNAAGKWFLFLDDDEWFEDTRELIAFFQSGEYQKYHHAYYYQRNYSDHEGSKYNDAPVLRMVERMSDISFVYSIHECLYPVREPAKFFSTYVHHYGYVYDTEEQRLAKAKRNIELLEIEHENAPLDLHHVLQLVQEYGAIRDYERSMGLSEEGIAIWEQHYSASGNMQLYMNSLMANVTQCQLQLKQYAELLERGAQYVQKKAADPLAKALIQGRMAIAAYVLEKYESCISYVREYVRAYELEQKDGDYYKRYETSLTKMCFEKNMLQATLQIGAIAALILQKYEIAQDWINRIDWSKENTYVNEALVRGLVKQLGTAGQTGFGKQGGCTTQGDTLAKGGFTEQGAIGILLDMCNALLQREGVAAIFADNLLELDEPVWENFAGLRGEHWLFAYIELWQKARSSGAECPAEAPAAGASEVSVAGTSEASAAGASEATKPVDAELLHRLWSEPLALLRHSHRLRLWELMRRAGIDAAQALAEIPFYQWQNVVERLAAEEKKEALQQLRQEMCGEEATDIRSIYFALVVLRKQLANVQEQPEMQAVWLEAYIDYSAALYGELYSEEVIGTHFELLPLDYQLALLLSQAQLCLEEQDYKNAIASLKEVSALYPPFGALVKKYLLDIKESSSRAGAQQQELITLARQIKAQAQTLIAAGRQQEAMQILQQLERMLPGDAQVRSLMELCRGR